MRNKASSKSFKKVAFSFYDSNLSCDSGQVVPPEELEKIAFLVELTGCMIADEVEGEEPSIPIQLSEDTSNPSSTEAHAILRLSLDLIDFSMLLSETQMLRHLSTRSFETFRMDGSPR